MTHRNPITVRLLVFITLVTGACCFVIGIHFFANQSVARTPGASVSELEPLPRQRILNSEVALEKLTPSPQFPVIQPHLQVNEDAIPLNSYPESNIEKTDTKQSQEIPQGGIKTKTFAVPTQFQGKTFNKIAISGEQKVIALTFDDGPWPKTTLQVLNILKKNNIKATFFWVGQCVKNYPQLAQQVVAEGHAIANHTWSHSYRKMNASQAAHEIDDTADLIYKTTGVRTFLFRPPGGIMNNGPAGYAEQKNYAIAKWSNDPMDYRPLPAQKLIKNVLRKAKSGDIVLMHDGGGNHSATVRALPEIIDKLSSQGYKFVTVPELLEMKDREQ
ncbi:polysaccharide deacetylase family protein [Argonema galeatum]|uniref:polysaccharide deacetylase family protein n=1 Tax=Argonema galeatum TaxID=2942762 RepID=UPI002011BA40|nr:polysaccharide deacetylase family protein [Argonema galeatum]MCL1468847.1 polysaccharide deacetylase family protein [Argonema galeatum A003/A1]